MQKPDVDFRDWFPVRDPLYVFLYPPPFATPVLQAAERQELDRYLADPVQEVLPESCLYVHIPFCKSICAFCPLVNRLVVKDEVIKTQVLQALRKEILLYAATPRVQAMRFGSVYFGGGTPSLLFTETLLDLLELCKNHLNISSDAEITVEGSPSSFSVEKFQALSEWGVNRVSMGVQTFKDDVGAKLNLPQGADRVTNMVCAARQAGIRIVCGDLMYNLPHQSVAQWAENVNQAIALNLDLVSIYPLIIAPHTPLGKQYWSGQAGPVGDKYAEIEAYLIAWDAFAANGYIQDSLIDFCKPYARFRYGNLLDYEMRDLLGVGLGAFSKLGCYVFANKVPLTEYLSMIDREELPVDRGTKVSRSQEMLATMAMGLGHTGHVNRQQFHERFGRWPEHIFQDLLQPWLDAGLMTIGDQDICLTRQGMVWGANLGKLFYTPEFRPFEIDVKGTTPYKPFPDAEGSILQKREDLWGKQISR